MPSAADEARRYAGTLDEGEAGSSAPSAADEARRYAEAFDVDASQLGVSEEERKKKRKEQKYREVNLPTPLEVQESDITPNLSDAFTSHLYGLAGKGMDLSAGLMTAVTPYSPFAMPDPEVQGATWDPVLDRMKEIAEQDRAKAAELKPQTHMTSAFDIPHAIQGAAEGAAGAVPDIAAMIPEFALHAATGGALMGEKALASLTQKFGPAATNAIARMLGTYVATVQEKRGAGASGGEMLAAIPSALVMAGSPETVAGISVPELSKGMNLLLQSEAAAGAGALAAPEGERGAAAWMMGLGHGLGGARRAFSEGKELPGITLSAKDEAQIAAGKAGVKEAGKFEEEMQARKAEDIEKKRIWKEKMDLLDRAVEEEKHKAEMQQKVDAAEEKRLYEEQKQQWEDLASQRREALISNFAQRAAAAVHPGDARFVDGQVQPTLPSPEAAGEFARGQAHRQAIAEGYSLPAAIKISKEAQALATELHKTYYPPASAAAVMPNPLTWQSLNLVLRQIGNKSLAERIGHEVMPMGAKGLWERMSPEDKADMVTASRWLDAKKAQPRVEPTAQPPQAPQPLPVEKLPPRPQPPAPPPPPVPEQPPLPPRTRPKYFDKPTLPADAPGDPLRHDTNMRRRWKFLDSITSPVLRSVRLVGSAVRDRAGNVLESAATVAADRGMSVVSSIKQFREAVAPIVDSVEKVTKAFSSPYGAISRARGELYRLTLRKDVAPEAQGRIFRSAIRSAIDGTAYPQLGPDAMRAVNGLKDILVRVGKFAEENNLLSLEKDGRTIRLFKASNRLPQLMTRYTRAMLADPGSPEFKDFARLVAAMPENKGIDISDIHSELAAMGAIATERQASFEHARSITLPDAIADTKGRTIAILDSNPNTILRSMLEKDIARAAFAKEFGQEFGPDAKYSKDFHDASKRGQRVEAEGSGGRIRNDLEALQKEVRLAAGPSRSGARAAEDFRKMTDALQGRRQVAPDSYSTFGEEMGASAWTKAVVGTAMDILRVSNVSRAGFAQISETISGVLPTAGWRNATEAWKRAIIDGFEASTKDDAVWNEERRRLAATTDRATDWSFDPQTMASMVGSTGRAVTNTLGWMLNRMASGKKKATVMAFEVMKESIQQGRGTMLDGERLRMMDFNQAQIDLLLSGKADPQLYNDIVRRGAALAEGTGAIAAERPAAYLNPAFAKVHPYLSFALRNMDQSMRAFGQVYEAFKASPQPDTDVLQYEFTARQGAALKNLASHLGAKAAGGITYTALTALLRGGASQVAAKYQELKEHPIEVGVEMTAHSFFAGPAALAIDQWGNTNRSVNDQIVGLLNYPAGVIGEFLQYASSTGRYSGMSRSKATDALLAREFPLYTPIGNIAAAYGIGAPKDLQLKSAMYLYNKHVLPIRNSGVTTRRNDPNITEVREAMGEAMDYAKAGSYDGAVEKVNSVLLSRMQEQPMRRAGESVAEGIRGRMALAFPRPSGEMWEFLRRQAPEETKGLTALRARGDRDAEELALLLANSKLNEIAQKELGNDMYHRLWQYDEMLRRMAAYAEAASYNNIKQTMAVERPPEE